MSNRLAGKRAVIVGAGQSPGATEGNAAKLRQSITGRSGLVSPERARARKERNWEKRLRTQHSTMSPQLLQRIVDIYKEGSRDRSEKKAELDADGTQ